MSLIIKYSITKNVDTAWTWTKQYYALIVMAKFKTLATFEAKDSIDMVHFSFRDNQISVYEI